MNVEFVSTNATVGVIGDAVLWGMALSLIAVAPFLEKIGLRAAAFGASTELKKSNRFSPRKTWARWAPYTRM